MSDANFQQSLVHITNHHALRHDQGIQMQLLRFWADELAKPRNADPKRLLRYGFKVYSQCDEDGIIQEIFRRIGTGNRVFVEFGVETGIECNTVKLLVEGWRGLWQAIDVVRPRVVVIEYNATLRPPMSLVVSYEPTQTWNGTNYFGASLEALVRLGRKKGYRLVGCSFNGANAFFVQDEFAGDHFLDPATAEEHYEPPLLQGWAKAR